MKWLKQLDIAQQPGTSPLFLQKPSTYEPDFYLKKKKVPNDKSIYLTPTDYNETLKILQDLKPKEFRP